VLACLEILGYMELFGCFVSQLIPQFVMFDCLYGWHENSNCEVAYSVSIKFHENRGQLFKKFKRRTHNVQISNGYLLLKTEDVYLNICRAVLNACLLMVSLVA
jgi:hypothetical protein